MNREEFEHHLKIKICSYYVIVMEEEGDDFWYSCAKYAKAMNAFFRLKQQQQQQMKISEMCIFFHKRCIKKCGGNGEY